MKKFLISSAAIALTMAVAPASAQILGGGRGLGGGLGGGIGGQLGGGLGNGLGSSIARPELPQLPSRIDRTIDTTHQGTLTTKGERHVDTKSGNVSASRSVDGSLNNTLNTSGNGMTASGASSAQGSANGSANAQLIGTDTLRSTTTQAVGAARDKAQMARDTALTTAGNAKDRALMAAGTAKDRTTNAVGAVRDRAGTLTANATGTATGAAALTNGMATGSADGSANGSANGASGGGLGNLALAGTGAANGQGMFAVTPGMPVTDARGKVIGTVDSVATNARGRVQQVRMAVGNKVATLPASNFSGEGNVLVSAMGKSEVKKAAAPEPAPAPKN